MTHEFKIALADLFGIEEAIIIHNFHYWIMENRANDRNFFDGRYWTYNSQKAYVEMFPYMNECKIKRIINGLVEKGILMKGNFNANQYDRTNWYAFTDEGLAIVQKYYIHQSKMTNGIVKNDRPIPNNKPNNKTISISNTPSDEGSDRDIQQDAAASSSQMPTLVENKLTAPSNKNVTSEESAKLFEELWMLYERKGNKQIAKNEFAKLNPAEEEIAKIRMHIPAYIEAQPEKKYRLDFERYIKRRTFESVVYSKDNAVLYDPDAEIQPKKSDADIKAPVNDSFYR